MSLQLVTGHMSLVTFLRFGIFYESDRPTKNALEQKWIQTSREKVGNASDLDLLQKTFDRMK
jgi:2-oxoglutarate/2-oxoacid ferredoxin oxidoreductase subunit beta